MVDGVAYYSIAGRTAYHYGGAPCDVDDAPEFIRKWRFWTDPVDPLLALSEALIDGGFGSPYANDGLLRVGDAKWGRFLGCVPADHLDQIGQLLGDKPGLFNAWDYREFYRELVHFLHEEGF